jgi:hypothetical protein
VLVLAGEYDVGLPPQNAPEYAGLFEHAELAARRRALSLARQDTDSLCVGRRRRACRSQRTSSRGRLSCPKRSCKEVDPR